MTFTPLQVRGNWRKSQKMSIGHPEPLIFSVKHAIILTTRQIPHRRSTLTILQSLTSTL
ncbi:hypothetical protein Cflav_PD2267 [Pedosphaera parvula Ellin514]|uniref:Uncharacterized protein n=1 Tax=Pedosphaera parvula (strain Ellin514) TaxID=320771 RepID=B9XL72_PEDPL|nr:hypothetical protein Cflav_PD2267 [Pedosphaera parvula Ellin514]